MVKNQRGFSLVELLVVTVIMGLVIGAVYSLYISTQKTAITSEEVVDVQQNLRFALDQLAKDIRMAGFLTTGGVDPIESEPISLSVEDKLIFRTSVVDRHFARIVGDYIAGSTTFNVASAEMVDLFETNNDDIAIVRPIVFKVEDDELLGTYHFVADYEKIFEGKLSGKDRSAPSLTIDSGTSTAVQRGDMITKGVDETIVYSLESDDSEGENVRVLMRNGEPVANKVAEVNLEYIKNSGRIVAVRVQMEGQTDETMTGREGFSGIKTRAVESVVRLRNR